VGLYNAPGGKVKFGELLEEAAILELEEEVGIKAKNLEFMRISEFYEEILYVYVYIVTEFDGNLWKLPRLNQSGSHWIKFLMIKR